MTDESAAAPRKPRVALMGEFSAGKSTLSNLLMGARPLPEKVTATRLSPVWISRGTDDPYRIDIDGTVEPVSLENLEDLPVQETRVIRLFMESDILEVCDLIDFPGISDPNMSSEVWERMLTEVDAVIWCTHATQAWRQSEAAVWDTMPDSVRENSILLITRYDKLITDRDRLRVLKRVNRETKGLFGAVFPVSLLKAIQAGDDYDLWDASGAGPFTQHLIDTIDVLTKLAARTERPLYNYGNDTVIPEAVVAPVVPRRVQRSAEGERPARPAAPEGAETDAAGRIIRTS